MEGHTSLPGQGGPRSCGSSPETGAGEHAPEGPLEAGGAREGPGHILKERR